MKFLSDTVQAILLFIYVLLSAAIIIGIVRHISVSFHTFQIVLCYNAFALVCMIPWLYRKGLKEAFNTTRWGLYSARAVLEFVSFSLSFYALTLIPLSMHTSLLFCAPIFGTIIAILVLKERPNLYAYVCIGSGFLGVLIITRPGIEGVNEGIVFALLAALGFASCGNIIKFLTRTETSNKIAFFMLLMTTAISIPFGLYHWVAPEAIDWMWLAIIGLLAYSQQLAVAESLSKVPYTTVIPLNFVQLIFIAVIAYFFFDEVIEPLTVVGAIVIIAGTLFNAYMSARESRRAKTRAAMNPSEIIG
ncbi:MAG: DMT family transporter [Rickettsiales bacterium]|nr:DMT family transporter [Rickettsiales bacterium]